MDASLPTDALPQFSHQQILRVVTGIMLCVLLASLDQTVVIPAVPAIAGDLNAFGHLSWIVTAYLLTSTAATPIIGKLSDLWGRRTLLLPSIALFMLASVFCALAQTLPQLIAARALQGLGGAGLLSMAQAAVADVVSPRERGRYQGYMASMWGIASTAGPILGGWVTDHLSWRWVFWINLPLGLLAMWLCDRALRSIVVRRRAARIDYAGAALLVGVVVTCLLVLSWGGTEFPWSSNPIVGLSVGTVLLLGGLVWQERRVADPILPPRLFGHPVFLRGVLIAFFGSLALLGATFLLPLHFQLVMGKDASTSGVLVVPFLAANVCGAFVSGQTARRLGRTKGLLLTGLTLGAIGFALLSLGDARTPALITLPVTVMLGLGIGITMPSVLMTVQNAAERRDVGAATGSLLFLRSMGGAFGSTVVGTLLATRFASGLVAAGIAKPIDLGALRQGSDAFAGLGEGAREQARDALVSAFHLSYWVCGALVIVAIGITLSMQDLQLRSSEPEPGGLAH